MPLPAPYDNFRLERESALQRARGDALETKVAKMTEAAKEMSSLRAQKV